MTSIFSDELDQLQHYYDYMYIYIGIGTLIYYLALSSFGFMIKFLMIEINKRSLFLKGNK